MTPEERRTISGHQGQQSRQNIDLIHQISSYVIVLHDDS